MAKEQIPQISKVQQLVLISYSIIKSLQINNIKVQSIKEAQAVIEDLLILAKITIITKFNINILDKLNSIYNKLLKQKTFIRNRTRLELTKKKLKNY